MTESRARQKIEILQAEARPPTKLGGALLGWYIAELRLEHVGRTCLPIEVAMVRDLCGLIESLPDPVSLTHLDAWVRAGTSAFGRSKRSRVRGRLIRLLEAHVEGFETASQRASNQWVIQALGDLPETSQRPLRAWVHERRTAGVSWNGLRQEVRRLTALERLLHSTPEVEHQADLIPQWIVGLTRRIVACDCAPVTRVKDPTRCIACGKTADQVGLRASPSEEKQKALRSLGLKYLAHRKRVMAP